MKIGSSSIRKLIQSPRYKASKAKVTREEVARIWSQMTHEKNNIMHVTTENDCKFFDQKYVRWKHSIGHEDRKFGDDEKYDRLFKSTVCILSRKEKHKAEDPEFDNKKATLMSCSDESSANQGGK